MKRSISILLCIVLVLSSFSFAFADFGSTDSTNLSNVAARLYYNGSSAAYYLAQIYSRLATTNTTLTTISTTLNTISNYLYADGHSVAYWVSAIDTWMSPLYNAITNGVTGTDIESILNMLSSVSNSGGVTVRTPYLYFNDKSVANYLYDFNNYFLTSTGRSFAGWTSFNGDNISSLYSGTIAVSPFGTALMTALNYINTNTTRGLSMLINRGLTGYNTTQNVVNWGNLGTSTFTPSSGVDGLYKYLGSIQAPVARLSYVLASDERIEAQEAAAANEEAVVDNFIDSSGAGSASTSDISSIADLSGGFQDNIKTDASPLGIWAIFNASNGSWFSQETANQLDTTNNNRKGNSQEYETPLLDQNIEEIYSIIGGGN